jgi:hypothetical protein
LGETILNNIPSLGDIVVSRKEKIAAIVENIMSLPSPRIIVRSIDRGALYHIPLNAIGLTWDIVT